MLLDICLFVCLYLMSLIAMFIQEFERLGPEHDCDCVPASGHSVCPWSKWQ